MTTKLGILGGTFDPIHIGHLAIAREARDRLDLGRVLFIPSFAPPHKEQDSVAAAEERLAMVRLAVQGEDRFEASDMEIRRGGRSYTVQTLREVAGNLPVGELPYLITGADSLIEVVAWREVDEVFRLCRFVGVTRPGFDIAQAPEAYRRQALILTGPHVDVSSTGLRNRIAEGRPIRGLVPDSVEAYIHDRGLYRLRSDEL